MPHNTDSNLGYRIGDIDGLQRSTPAKCGSLNFSYRIRDMEVL